MRYTRTTRLQKLLKLCALGPQLGQEKGLTAAPSPAPSRLLRNLPPPLAGTASQKKSLKASHKIDASSTIYGQLAVAIFVH